MRQGSLRSGEKGTNDEYPLPPWYYKRFIESLSAGGRWQTIISSHAAPNSSLDTADGCAEGCEPSGARAFGVPLESNIRRAFAVEHINDGIVVSKRARLKELVISSVDCFLSA